MQLLRCAIIMREQLNLFSIFLLESLSKYSWQAGYGKELFQFCKMKLRLLRQHFHPLLANLFLEYQLQLQLLPATQQHRTAKMGGRSHIGVGLGVGAGIPILAAFAAIGYLLFRGRMPKEDAIEPDMDDWLEYPPEVPAKDPIEVCGAKDVRHEVVGDLEDMWKYELSPINYPRI